MPRVQVQVGSASVLFSPDDSPPVGDRMQALARVRVLDELTGKPAASPFNLQTTLVLAQIRRAGDGIGGLVGMPHQVFPKLKTQAYDFQITVSAEGYVSQQFAFHYPSTPTFPDTFTLQPEQVVSLHRSPTTLYGRVVDVSGISPVPVTGATVRLTGVWRMVPPANAAPPPDAPNLVSLQPPLYADTPSPGGNLFRRNSAPVVGQNKTLLTAVTQPTAQIRLSNRVSLNIGDILLIDPDNPDRTEWLEVTAINGGVDPNEPAWVTLRYSLVCPHSAGVTAQRVTLAAAGANNTVSLDALAGDAVVFLSGLNGLTSAQQVEITGGANPEYHACDLFSVQTDADGYYRLPPLSRVAQIQIQAQKPPFADVEFKFRPDYSSDTNRLDIQFR